MATASVGAAWTAATASPYFLACAVTRAAAPERTSTSQVPAGQEPALVWIAAVLRVTVSPALRSAATAVNESFLRGSIAQA